MIDVSPYIEAKRACREAEAKWRGLRDKLNLTVDQMKRVDEPRFFLDRPRAAAVFGATDWPSGDQVAAVIRVLVAARAAKAKAWSDLPEEVRREIDRQ